MRQSLRGLWDGDESGVVALQAQVRGVLVRRRVRTQLAKLDDVSDVVVRIQAAVRTYLARKRLLNLIRSLRKATPALVGLQAVARAKLARQQHEAMHRALGEVKVVKAVGIFQARARAALARASALCLAALTGCAGMAWPPGDTRRVTIEHEATAAADEVAARAMQACRQAGKANAAFETIKDRPSRLPAAARLQASTYRCTP